MYQKLALLLMGCFLALTGGEARLREEDLVSPQDGSAGLQLHLRNGLADCEEDTNPSLCISSVISEGCEKDPVVKRSCQFSCSLSGQLWRASWEGNLETVNDAITLGANPLCHNNNNNELYDELEYPHSLLYYNYLSYFNNSTAIHLAAFANHPRVVKALLEAGVDVDLQTTDGTTPTFYASWNGSIDALNILIGHNADVNLAAPNGYTPLMAAAEQGQLSVAKALISANASLDVTGGRWWNATALYYAAKYGNPNIALLLIEHNANVNIAPSNGYTPLMAAASGGPLSVVKALINANASLDVIHRPGGYTALHYAALNNNKDTAVLLIENGTSLDITDGWGNTALHYAAWANNKDIAVLLIENGAYTRIPNKDGDNPADEARLRGHNKLAELIESYTKQCRSGVLRPEWC